VEIWLQLRAPLSWVGSDHGRRARSPVASDSTPSFACPSYRIAMTEQAAVHAEWLVVFIRPDGRRVDGRIWIGLPERVDEREARCSFGIDGLHERLQPVSGNDTLQALLLAVRLGATLLQHFRQEGGRIVRPGDDRSVDLEPYFGTLVRPTSAFTEEELDWTRPDVAAVFSFHGLATTTPADRDQLGNWLRKHGYTWRRRS